MLTFDDKKHEYKWNGVRVPSVSQIAKFLDGQRFKVKNYKKYMELGSEVHWVAEILMKKEIQPINIYYRGYADAIIAAARELEILDDIKHVEEIFCCKLAGQCVYAGKIDLITSKYLIDWKTGATCRYDIIQLNGYHQMNTKKDGERIYLSNLELLNIYIKDDGSYKIVRRKPDNTIKRDFLAGQSLFVKYQF